MKKSRKILIPVILAAVLSSCSKQNTSVKLPDFKGVSFEEISEWAEKNDIHANYTFLETFDYEEGICISEQPDSQTDLKPGSDVTFVIAKRPDIKIDPDPIIVPTDPILEPDDIQAPDTEKYDGDPDQDSRPVEEPISN